MIEVIMGDTLVNADRAWKVDVLNRDKKIVVHNLLT